MFLSYCFRSADPDLIEGVDISGLAASWNGMMDSHPTSVVVKTATTAHRRPL